MYCCNCSIFNMSTDPYCWGPHLSEKSVLVEMDDVAHPIPKRWDLNVPPEYSDRFDEPFPKMLPLHFGLCKYKLISFERTIAKRLVSHFLKFRTSIRNETWRSNIYLACEILTLVNRQNVRASLLQS